ncbi:hypothetical protein Vqi01_41670 [Micromonospora qiuiae]|uniref:Uncharacterized protein n=1 Tax=Micromonospora qiuiae TaxID=502268 RepID=A0ABQ4JFC9_9ACTN|nr:hypothetical protein [Micromonospora qiuiae]GIJ29005.1 hypothetical protein Vqi01_41670 [Micromonospora qiuiae]
MRAEHVDRLTDTLSNLPAKIDTPILTAWNAKEDLLDLVALARTHPHRQTVARLLHRFYTAAPPLTCSNYTASPPRSRPGGQKSTRSCIPA